MKLNYRWVKCEVTRELATNPVQPRTIPRTLPPRTLAVYPCPRSTNVPVGREDV